jgi:hypothetical protein
MQTPRQAIGLLGCFFYKDVAFDVVFDNQEPGGDRYLKKKGRHFTGDPTLIKYH